MRVYIVFFLLITLSCNQQNFKKTYIQASTAIDTLHAKRKEINKNILFPVKSLIVDDKFVVYDRVQDDIFKVFQLPELNFLYSFGKIGKGPNEFIYIPDSGVKEYRNKLVVIDNIRYTEFEINSNGINKRSSIVLKTNVNGIDNFELVSDSFYICDNKICNNMEYDLISLKDKKLVRQFGDYPKFAKNVRKCDEKILCGTKINTSRQSDGRIVALYLYMNRVNFFDHTGELINTVIIGDERPLSHVPDANSILYRIGVCSDENHIYVLYAGVSEKEAIQQQFNTKFEVWNWDGKLLKTYVLDEAILSFAVSDRYRKIFCTSLNDSKHIYEYILPNI